MKKVLILFVCLLLVGCGNKNNEHTEEQKREETKQENKTDTEKFKKEYEDLNKTSVKMEIDEDAQIEYLDVDDTLDFLENGTGIIYIGFPSCPWCRNIIPILLNVAIDNNETVYYFNPQYVRGTDNEQFNKIMKILDKYLSVNSNGEKTLYVPDVYFVKTGNIVGHYLGSVSSQVNPYEELTKLQKQELYEIYKDLLDRIN